MISTATKPQSIFPPRSFVAPILTRNDSHHRLGLCRRCLRGTEFRSRAQRLVSRSSSTGARGSSTFSVGASFLLLFRPVSGCYGMLWDVMGAKWEQIVRVASDTSQRGEFVIRPDDDSSTVTFLLRPVLSRGTSWETHLRHKS